MEVQDDFSEVDEVSFGFLEHMDRSDMEIAGHLFVHNEIAEEESFTYVGKELDIVIVQDDINVEMDVMVDLYVVDVAHLELYVHYVMDVIDVACGKKMDLLFGNMVEGFRGVIDVDLHDVVVTDMDLNLYVVGEMLKDTDVVTNVDFHDVVDLYVVGGMNIHVVSFMDLYVSAIMDLNSYVVANGVCDLDIVVDLVFMYEDDVMDDGDDKLQMEHYDF